MHQCADGTSHVRVSDDLSCDFLVLSGVAHLFLKVDYHIKIKAIEMSLVVLNLYFKINYKEKLLLVLIFFSEHLLTYRILIFYKTHWAKNNEELKSVFLRKGS